MRSGRATGLLALLWMGCADGEPGDTDDEVGFDLVRAQLGGCIGCHSGPAPDGALDLSGDTRQVLLDTPSGQSDLPLVEPGDALYSYLYHKVNGTQSVAGGAGSRMPLGEPWTEEQVERLALWIDLGARP